jgi:hypothetical protein
MTFRTAWILGVALAAGACGTTPPEQPPAPEEDQAAAELSPPEQSLRDRARRLLAERMGESAKRIRVRVQGTNLWLTGRAAGRWERDLAREIAHEVPGVTRVDVSGVAVN